MCGILAIKGKLSLSDDTVSKMLGTLSHRGPDEQKFIKIKDAILGQARLSIVDLSAGNQPMTDNSKSITIVFNGEIYDYQNLKKDLEEKSNKKPKHVGFFSLEMSAEQLTARMMAIKSEISVYAALSGKISKTDLTKLLESSALLQELPLIIDDSSMISITALRSRIRRMTHTHNLSAVFIDYLQLIKGSNRKSNENRVQEISEISRMLKTLARELDIPVLCLSQLSRKVEERQGHRPMMSDLRESGSIEQDADVVMFLMRRDYYESSDKPGMAEIIIAKNRHGAIGNIPLTFRKEIAQFANYASTP